MAASELLLSWYKAHALPSPSHTELHLCCRWASNHTSTVASLKIVHEPVSFQSRIFDVKLDKQLAGQLLFAIASAFGSADDQHLQPRQPGLMQLHLDSCLPCAFEPNRPGNDQTSGAYNNLCCKQSLLSLCKLDVFLTLCPVNCLR